MSFLALRYLLRVQSETPYKNFNKTESLHDQLYKSPDQVLRPDIFCKLISLNLIIFGRNEGNFGEKKSVPMNVKSKFCTKSLPR